MVIHTNLKRATAGLEPAYLMVFSHLLGQLSYVAIMGGEGLAPTKPMQRIYSPPPLLLGHPPRMPGFPGHIRFWILISSEYKIQK